MSGVGSPSWPTQWVVLGVAGSLAKRALDATLATLLLVALAPVLLVIAAAIRLTSRGPALFVQDRVGYRGLVFAMYKFRTMRCDAERLERQLAESQQSRTFFKLENDPRVTPLGRWLRKYSLDELPQLLNVMGGDMSLVGPRPLLLHDFGRFPSGKQLLRFAIKPGLTGLWQVSGRSLVSDSRRLELDLEYVDNWSLGLDLKILVRTIPAVLSTRGAW